MLQRVDHESPYTSNHQRPSMADIRHQFNNRCSNGESHHHRPRATRHPPRGPTCVHPQRRRTRSATHTARYITITVPGHHPRGHHLGDRHTRSRQHDIGQRATQPPPTEIPEPGHTGDAPSIIQTKLTQHEILVQVAMVETQPVIQ